MSILSIDPEDRTFTDSEACLFQPLPQEALRTYRIDKKTVFTNELECIIKFKDIFNEVTDMYLKGTQMWLGGRQVLGYLEVSESKLPEAEGGIDIFITGPFALG